MPQNHNSRIEGKKILFLITQSKYGGAQRYVLQLARFFAQRNTVLIAVGDAENKDEQFFAEAREIGIEPIVLDSLIRDISLVKAFDSLLDIRKLLYRERPDFLHINSSMAGAIGSCAAWVYRFDPLNKPVRVVYTAHGFVFNEPLPKLRKGFYRVVEKVSASWKGAIITVSDFDREQAIAGKIARPTRLVTIHNGIAPAEYASRTEARAKLGIASAGPVIGTIAALYPTKGLAYLIEAAAIVHRARPEAAFVIIGDGPEREMLEKQIATLGLQAVVLLTGAIEDASRLCAAFDVFTLASVKEGFPYALLEAGQAGIPIAATRVGGVPELIQHGADGLLVPAGDHAELAQAILTLLQDKQAAERYAAHLRQRISREFSLDRMLKETEELYLRFYTRHVPPAA